MSLSAKCIKYGDDINTDYIIAGKYTKTLDPNDLVIHCMEDLDADFHEKCQNGAFIVAGENFGCGSSREQAPVALKGSGVICVAAKSFSRIFYRSAINIGLPIVECDTSSINEGDELEYELGDETIVDKTTGGSIPAAPLPDVMKKILKAGGTVELFKKYGGFEGEVE